MRGLLCCTLSLDNNIQYMNSTEAPLFLKTTVTWLQHLKHEVYCLVQGCVLDLKCLTSLHRNLLAEWCCPGPCKKKHWPLQRKQCVPAGSSCLLNFHILRQFKSQFHIFHLTYMSYWLSSVSQSQIIRRGTQQPGQTRLAAVCLSHHSLHFCKEHPKTFQDLFVENLIIARLLVQTFLYNYACHAHWFLYTINCSVSEGK